MLDDENLINDVNPYVVHDFSLPGTLRKTFEFSDFTDQITDENILLQENLSPICEHAKTAGDRTIDMCTNGLRGVCPDTKIHPRRNIDPGFTEDLKDVKNKQQMDFADIEYVIYKNTDTRVMIIGIILTMILLISIR